MTQLVKQQSVLVLNRKHTKNIHNQDTCILIQTYDKAVFEILIHVCIYFWFI